MTRNNISKILLFAILLLTGCDKESKVELNEKAVRLKIQAYNKYISIKHAPEVIMPKIEEFPEIEESEEIVYLPTLSNDEISKEMEEIEKKYQEEKDNNNGISERSIAI